MLVEWSKLNGNKKPSFCCPTKEKKSNGTEAQLTEQKLAQWLGSQKKAKQGKGHSKCYASVVNILSQHFGEDWWKNPYWEQTQIDEANKLVEWSKLNGKKKPVACCSTKEKKSKATEAQLTEHKLASWLSNQKNVKQGKGYGSKCYVSVVNILSQHFGEGWWEFQDLEHAQIDKANKLVEWSKLNGKKPVACCSTKEQTAKAMEAQLIEHKWASWLSNQKNAKQGKGNGSKCYASVVDILSQHFGKGWWKSTRDSSDTSSISGSSESSELSQSSNTRVRKLIHVPSEKDVTTGKEKRSLSKIEKLHQVYKRMKGANFTKRMQDNPTEWHEYHEIAKTYDCRDKISPLDKITTALQSVKSGRKAIDLGCGLNSLQKKNTHLKWRAIDAIAVDYSVTEGDLTDLPFKDETFHVAVLCRALWAIDREQVLSEAHRVLIEGGQLIIVEAFRGWYDEDSNTNELMGLVDKTDFEVVSRNGTLPNETDDVFQYIILRKKNHDIII